MSRLTIPMSDRGPVVIDPDDWKVIAHAEGHERGTAGLTTRWITARQHSDGRRVVYGGAHTVANFAPASAQTEPGSVAGYLLPSSSSPETERAIRRVAGSIDARNLIDEMIAALPPEEI